MGKRNGDREDIDSYAGDEEKVLEPTEIGNYGKYPAHDGNTYPCNTNKMKARVFPNRGRAKSDETVDSKREGANQNLPLEFAESEG